MRQFHFGRRGSALGSLGLLAACAMGAASGGCRLEVTDGSSSGGSGDGSGGITASGEGGATTALGGAPSGSGGAASTGQGGATNGAAQGGSASAGAGPVGGTTNTEDCAHPDVIPNDDRAHAVDFGTGATVCVADDTDEDWFYIDTPSDGRAHVIELDINETADSWVDIYVTAENDGSNLGRIHPTQRGLKLSAFVTVGPGTRTWFDVEGYVRNTGTTTINVSVSAEADDHEPNNDRASATLIQPGSEISAQLILPYVSATDQQVQDWYKAELGAGKHTFRVTSVPTDLYPNVQVSDSTSAILTSSNHGPNRGAKFAFDFNADKAGTYYFKVDNLATLDVLYSGTKADSYSQPYKFQID